MKKAIEIIKKYKLWIIGAIFFILATISVEIAAFISLLFCDGYFLVVNVLHKKEKGITCIDKISQAINMPSFWILLIITIIFIVLAVIQFANANILLGLFFLLCAFFFCTILF